MSSYDPYASIRLGDDDNDDDDGEDSYGFDLDDEIERSDEDEIQRSGGDEDEWGVCSETCHDVFTNG